jgi:hypothetical protein
VVLEGLAVAELKVVAGVMGKTAHVIRVAPATVVEVVLVAEVAKEAQAEWEGRGAMAVGVTISPSIVRTNSLEQLFTPQTEEEPVNLAVLVAEAHPA